MKIAIITDAWLPQLNGVAVTLGKTTEMLRKAGHDVFVIEPALFKTFPCPSYPEIRLAWRPAGELNRLMSQFSPDAVHIATEGTLGWAGRSWCRANGVKFTTSYHTQFPEYVRARYPIPVGASYAALRIFHGAAVRTMVATPSLERRLQSHGFRNLVRWTRGVDLDLFKPYGKTYLNLPRPISIYVGRIAVEKNIEAFLDMKMEGTKVVVGEGPARQELEQKYPGVVFLGRRTGEELGRIVAGSDVFVFPSRTDTFGLVLLEAMACGVPVAAFPVMGPIDVVQRDVTGKLDENLARAAGQALELSPQHCREHALRYTWHNATQQFLSNLHNNNLPVPSHADRVSTNRSRSALLPIAARVDS